MAIHQRPNGAGRVRTKNGRHQAYAPGANGRSLGSFGSRKEAEDAITAWKLERQRETQGIARGSR